MEITQRVEGGITVVRRGVQVMRCERLWISPLEDRIVAEGVELLQDAPVVLLLGLALPGEHRHTGLGNSGRRVVLGREDVA